MNRFIDRGVSEPGAERLQENIDEDGSMMMVGVAMVCFLLAALWVAWERVRVKVSLKWRNR